MKHRPNIPRGIFAAVTKDDFTCMVPINCEETTFQLLMNDEIMKLSDKERETYVEKEKEYCMLHPQAADAHFEVRDNDEYVSQVEQEYENQGSVSPDDDY